MAAFTTSEFTSLLDELLDRSEREKDGSGRPAVPFGYVAPKDAVEELWASMPSDFVESVYRENEDRETVRDTPGMETPEPTEPPLPSIEPEAIAAELRMATARWPRDIDRIRRDLMNNLTHELKTPISTIGLASEALGDPDMLKDPDGTKHYIALIKEENKRLAVLVENVLQASLADSGKMQLFLQPVNAHDLIKEVLRNLAIQIRKRGGKVELHLDASNPLIEADRIHFTNVIFNLVDNALKYSSGDPMLTISTVQATDGLELRFQDNGIGIGKEHLGKVFDRLYRVPTGNVHDVKGFGLGLSYVKTVVDRHNGTIRVESELEQGSTFVLLLPQ